MRSLIFSFILLIFCSTFLFAQIPLRDSLLNELSANNKRDSSRIDILFELFKYELSTNLDSALIAANEMLDIGIEMQDKRTEGLARLYKSIYYGKKARYDKAITEGTTAVELLEKSGKKEDLLLARSELGSYYRVTHEPEKALEISLKILDIVKTMEESPNNARYYFEVGNTYGTLKKFKEAEKYFKEAIKISKKFDFKPGEMAGKHTLVQVYNETNELDKSISLSEELINYYQTTGNKSKLISSQYFLGSTKMKLNQHQEAIPLLEAALKGFKEMKRDLFVEKAAQKLYICYSIIKEHEKAEAANKIYLSTYDTIQSQKQKELTESIKEKYETDKLKQEKLIETERAKRNRNLFIISTIAGLLLLGISFLYIYQQRLKKRAEFAEMKLAESENKLTLERKLNNAEMKALKAQMNPHFLFNAFNSIQEFIIMNNREMASNYLGKFADLMRLYLDHSREKTISLEEEVSAAELYLELEKIRFEDKLNYQIHVEENVDQSRTYLPPMLIQPFIENSLKHGLLHKKDDRQLNIKFEMLDNVLHCSIIDNGIGRKQSALLNQKKLKKHKSFATSATENRIELLNIGREKNITMKIIDLKNDEGEATGTKVIIQIPNENTV